MYWLVIYLNLELIIINNISSEFWLYIINYYAAINLNVLKRNITLILLFTIIIYDICSRYNIMYEWIFNLIILGMYVWLGRVFWVLI